MKNKFMTPFLVYAMLALIIGSQLLISFAQTDEVDERITANNVSLDPTHPNSYTNFAPELPSVLARVPQLNPETGVYYEEVKPNLYYVTGGIYTSAFLVTDEGVVVFDAPPSYAHAIPDVIQEVAPDQPITYLIYSHGHNDHVGGTGVFADVPELQIVAPHSVADSIAESGNPNILMPTVTYDDHYTLTVGGELIELQTANFHAEDHDVIIYLPNQKFLMAIDTLTPGEVPFMNFGATADVGEYLNMFDQLLAYDFDILLTGHLSFLATRDDVLASQAYAFDTQAQVLSRMPSFGERFNNMLALIDYQNGNLAYRMVIEEIQAECSSELINNWQGTLSVVDVWADSHCETMILYYITH